MSQKTLGRLMRQTLTQMGHNMQRKISATAQKLCKKKKTKTCSMKGKARRSKQEMAENPLQQGAPPADSSSSNGECTEDAATNDIRKYATRRWLRR